MLPLILDLAALGAFVFVALVTARLAWALAGIVVVGTLAVLHAPGFLGAVILVASLVIARKRREDRSALRRADR